jgi:acetoin utilization deacetylase AcuC-like enzyme
VNAPLRAGAGSNEFRSAFAVTILPALEAFSPDLVMISAGFDGHRHDPLAGIALDEEDFAWATEALATVARRHAEGRIVSLLEGGYDLDALASSAAAHVRVLMNG